MLRVAEMSPVSLPNYMSPYAPESASPRCPEGFQRYNSRLLAGTPLELTLVSKAMCRPREGRNPRNRRRTGQSRPTGLMLDTGDDLGGGCRRLVHHT